MSTAAELYSRIYAVDSLYRMGPLRQDRIVEWLGRQELGSLMDVGTGRGETVGFAKGMGFEASGCEIVPSLCDGAVQLIESITRLEHLRGQPYDYVTCLDVLEHIEPDDTEAALLELWIITGRKLVVSIGLHEDRWRRHRVHINLRTPEEWLKLLREATGRRPSVLHHDEGRVVWLESTR